jgi:hypothetical protein
MMPILGRLVCEEADTRTSVSACLMWRREGTAEQTQEKYRIEETTCRASYGGVVQLLSSHTALNGLGNASAGSQSLNGRVICTFRSGMQQKAEGIMTGCRRLAA